MKTVCSVNRSGKAGSPSQLGGGRVIPFNPGMPLTPLSMSTYVIFSDIYGVIWSPSQIVQTIQKMGTECPLFIGYLVMPRIGGTDVEYYDLLAVLTIEQLSDGGLIDDQPSVTIVRRFAPVRALAGIAGEYTYENVRYLDQMHFRQHKVVLVPDNTLPVSGEDKPLWSASLDMTNAASGALGTVTNLSPDQPVTFSVMRSPVGGLKGDDMTMCRFTPAVELDIISEGQISQTYVGLADINSPVAISADGAKLYFAGYYSEPRGMDEAMAPIMQYAFLSQPTSGPMDHAPMLANVALLTLGPTPAVV